MPSWVRFSIAVYLGLLLAGAVIGPRPLSADGGDVVSKPEWADRVAERAIEREAEAGVERDDAPARRGSAGWQDS
ncbi:MAG: hypothetical protein AAF823_08880 [Planctomycetota bacterium]